MRPGAVKIESIGSFWWFDEATHEYMRLPKNEMPRERPDWSDERAGVLQDAVWHPYVSYSIGPVSLHMSGLFIEQPDGQVSFAPIYNEEGANT